MSVLDIPLASVNERLNSPNIWWNSNYERIQSNPGLGRCYFDDFLNFPKLPTNTTTPAGNQVYAHALDLNPTIDQLGADVGTTILADEGWVKMFVTDDNLGGAFGLSGTTGVIAQINDTGANARRLHYQTRIAVGSIAAGSPGFFAGFAEAGQVDEDFIADAGTLIDKDLIGFWRDEAAPTVLKFVYRKEGSAVQSLITDIALVANTPIEIGFVYDPNAPTSKRGTIYVNNVEHATHLTGAQIAAALFPNGVLMSALYAFKSADANDQNIYIDGIRFCQHGR